MTGFYKTLPFELEEAAAIDGASPFRTFWQIMLPLARPGIASLLMLNFVTWWNEFFYALLFIRDSSQYTAPWDSPTSTSRRSTPDAGLASLPA